MLETHKKDIPIIQSVIDDARWLIWRTATPDQVKRIQDFKDKGYIWYCAGAGWVYLANMEADPILALKADTAFGAWKFADEDIPALINWHGFKSWDWKRGIGR